MRTNKYIEAITKAYRNKEMEMLFGCRDEYAVDENGEYYLMQDMKFTCRGPEDSDPINLQALISAAELYYYTLDRSSGQKKQFIEDLTAMLSNLIKSNRITDLYFATRIYYILGERGCEDSFYPFGGIYQAVKLPLSTHLNASKNALKAEKIYVGRMQENGLWEVLHIDDNIAEDPVKLIEIDWDN